MYYLRTRKLVLIKTTKINNHILAKIELLIFTKKKFISFVKKSNVYDVNLSALYLIGNIYTNKPNINKNEFKFPSFIKNRNFQQLFCIVNNQWKNNPSNTISFIPTNGRCGSLSPAR